MEEGILELTERGWGYSSDKSEHFSHYLHPSSVFRVPEEVNGDSYVIVE